jgi:hypothetical protein
LLAFSLRFGPKEKAASNFSHIRWRGKDADPSPKKGPHPQKLLKEKRAWAQTQTAPSQRMLLPQKHFPFYYIFVQNGKRLCLTFFRKYGILFVVLFYGLCD